MKLSRSDQSEVIQILKTTDFSQSSHFKPSLQLDNEQNITSLPHSQSEGFKNQLHESQFWLTKMQESCSFKEQLVQKLETEIEQLGLELNSPVMRNTIQKKTGNSKGNNPMQLQSNKDPSKSTLPEQVRFDIKTTTDSSNSDNCINTTKQGVGGD